MFEYKISTKSQHKNQMSYTVVSYSLYLVSIQEPIQGLKQSRYY